MSKLFSVFIKSTVFLLLLFAVDENFVSAQVKIKEKIEIHPQRSQQTFENITGENHTAYIEIEWDFPNREAYILGNAGCNNSVTCRLDRRRKFKSNYV